MILRMGPGGGENNFLFLYSTQWSWVALPICDELKPLTIKNASGISPVKGDPI